MNEFFKKFVSKCKAYSKWISGAVVTILIAGGLLNSYVSYRLDMKLEVLKAAQTQKETLKEIQVKFLDDLTILNKTFAEYMSALAADNEPPLDPALIEKMADNLRSQNQTVELLLASLHTQDSQVFSEYQESLLATRTELLNSNDPGDLENVWPQVVQLTEKQLELSSVILGE